MASLSLSLSVSEVLKTLLVCKEIQERREQIRINSVIELVQASFILNKSALVWSFVLLRRTCRWTRRWGKCLQDFYFQAYPLIAIKAWSSLFCFFCVEWTREQEADMKWVPLPLSSFMFNKGPGLAILSVVCGRNHSSHF